MEDCSNLSDSQVTDDTNGDKDPSAEDIGERQEEEVELTKEEEKAKEAEEIAQLERERVALEQVVAQLAKSALEAKANSEAKEAQMAQLLQEVAERRRKFAGK